MNVCACRASLAKTVRSISTSVRAIPARSTAPAMTE